MGHYQGYYRPCEARHVAVRKLRDAHRAEGRDYVTTELLPVCGPDGYHAPVQPVKGQAGRGYCSDLLGNQLEAFEGDLASMDCQCALVRNR
jgi:hypothetical protein